MKQALLNSLKVWFLLTLITGILYPATVWIGGHVLWSWQSEGSQLVGKSGLQGSAVIGQRFIAPGYFHGRPSATGDSTYNPLASGASNFGPSNPDLRDSIAARAKALCGANPCTANGPPAQLLQASASGLDPEISPEAAEFQVARIALARNISSEKLLALIQAKTENRLWGIYGEPRVNVLLLNQELDRLASAGQ